MGNRSSDLKQQASKSAGNARPAAVTPVPSADPFSINVFPYSGRVSGACYTWGWGAHGQLGHGNDSSEHSPRLVEGLGKKCGVSYVSCGHFHTLIVTDRGELYSCGRGDINGSCDKDVRPRLLLSLRGVNVVTCAGGRAHSLALSDNGWVYAWGDSKFGQVGTICTTIPDAQTPTGVVEALRNKCINQISCGEEYSAAGSTVGTLWTWGRADQGRLGRPPPVHVSAKLRFMRRPVTFTLRHLACGSHHTVAVATDGRVLVWGYHPGGDHLDSPGGDCVPRVIESLARENVIRCAAGSRHSLVLTERGEVFSWGNGLVGQLGHGPATTTSLKHSKTKIVCQNESTPKLIASLIGMRIIQVAAGGLHSLVLNEDGIVYGFGHAGYGQLSQATWRTTVEAIPVVVKGLSGARVFAISAGAYHSAALCIPIPSHGAVSSFGGVTHWQESVESGVAAPLPLREAEEAQAARTARVAAKEEEHQRLRRRGELANGYSSGNIVFGEVGSVVTMIGGEAPVHDDDPYMAAAIHSSTTGSIPIRTIDRETAGGAGGEVGDDDDDDDAVYQVNHRYDEDGAGDRDHFARESRVSLL